MLDMNFIQLKDKCILQTNKTLEAICHDEAQRVAVFKAINLIIDSSYESEVGDEQSSQLLLNSALFVVGNEFGKAAESVWVILNQIKFEILECINAFDSADEGCIRCISCLMSEHINNPIEDIIFRCLKQEYPTVVEFIQNKRNEYKTRLQEVDVEISRLFKEERIEAIEYIGIGVGGLVFNYIVLCSFNFFDCFILDNSLVDWLVMLVLIFLGLVIILFGIVGILFGIVKLCFCRKGEINGFSDGEGKRKEKLLLLRNKRKKIEEEFAINVCEVNEWL